MKTYEKDILCEKCKAKIGVEVSGKEKYCDRPGNYYYCNTFMWKNSAGDNLCKKCKEIQNESSND